MGGFLRRYSYTPGLEVITEIEGVICIDMPPPGTVQGVGVGVACFVGEAADMTLATIHDKAGVISTLIQPQEVFGSTDLLNKIGGWDPTLGDWGKSMGNLFAALRNKKFSRLIIQPVNMASAQGARFVRQLPLCTSATNTTPVMPVSGATVAAGCEFRASSGRLKVAASVQFSAYPTIKEGVAGVTVSGGSAATQVFRVAAFDWSTIVRPDGSLGAQKGDILVIGCNNAGALLPLLEAGTYRVQATPASGTDVTVERLDGALFAWTAQTAVPFRLHRSPDADSAPERVLGTATAPGYKASETGAYIVPIRPITNSSGAQADGTYTAASVLTPAVVPPAITGDTWDVLSGLQGILHPGTATAFTAKIQGINPVTDATIDALYATALDGLISLDDPQRDINIVVCARKSTTIAAKLKSHVLEASQTCRGRIAVIAPHLQIVSVLDATLDTASGVGVNRDERMRYAWPGCLTFVPEAVGTMIATADGNFTSDGKLDEPMDNWLASLLSILPPERSAAQVSPPVPAAFSGILGVQRGVSGLGMGEYILMRQRGIAGLRMDRSSGPCIQSDMTTSLISGEQDGNRRRFADFWEDSVDERLVQMANEPLTDGVKDDALTEIVAFANELLSPNNPAARRIAGYKIDIKSGNTPDLEAKGIFTIICLVQMTPIGKFLVVQNQIGPGVQIS